MQMYGQADSMSQAEDHFSNMSIGAKNGPFAPQQKQQAQVGSQIFIQISLDSSQYVFFFQLFIVIGLTSPLAVQGQSFSPGSHSGHHRGHHHALGPPTPPVHSSPQSPHMQSQPAPLSPHLRHTPSVAQLGMFSSPTLLQDLQHQAESLSERVSPNGLWKCFWFLDFTLVFYYYYYYYLSVCLSVIKSYQ
jgi:hypothetical protein